jgi:hypothetical protein
MDWNRAKIQTETLAPWITIVGLIIAGVYTLIEYRSAATQKHVEMTMAYIARYSTPPLYEHRVALSKVWGENYTKIIDLVQSKDPDVDQRYNDYILSMIDREKISASVDEMLLYFGEVANCVHLGLCDAETVNSLLMNRGTEFVHQYVPYVCRLRSTWHDPTIGSDVVNFFNPAATDFCPKELNPSVRAIN